jgi:hypothetical protein
MRRLLTTTVLVVSTAIAALAWGAGSPIGTWVKQPNADDKGLPGMTMSIEKWGDDVAKLTYLTGSAATTITITATLDGSEAPLLVNGKPSGQTMSIKRVDDHHATSVQKVGGKTIGTSKATFSPDFTKLTVETDFTVATPGHAIGKSTEIWLRK